MRDVTREPAPKHLLQFYEADDGALVRNVGSYLAEGLRTGEGAIVAATPAHWTLFATHLRKAGLDVAALVAEGTLTYLDADNALERILVGGYPDAARFDAILGAAVRDALRSGERARVYGELVNILWTRGQYPAAIRLEQLWHRLLSALPFSLFCAYNIDVFDTGFDTGLLDALLRAHSHLLPSGCGDELVEALNAALQEVTGPNKASRIMLKAGDYSRRGWPSLPRTEAMILWLRQHMPVEAPDVFRRAKALYREKTAGEPIFSAESAG
ncbi:MAG: MEDS domain-containing protein [Candidatus Velthaea sp.]